MKTLSTCFAPIDAATGRPVELAMQRLCLSGRVLPAGARLTVQHVFRSKEEKPLEAIYSFALPRDAALRRFRILGDGFEAHSELRDTEEAMRAYEDGIREGSLATMARQFGDGVVNLTVGNIRPGETVTVLLDILAGVELRDDGFRFRFPFTLAPGYHPRARSVVVEPGEGRMELPAGEFGEVVLPRFRQDASGLHEVGCDLAIVTETAVEGIASPSHNVQVTATAGEGSRVALAAGHDVPDRDLVLDARYSEIRPQVLGGRGPEGKTQFAAVVPSASFGGKPESPRRVVILLDRSGSMQGAPLAQAVQAIAACLGALSEQDSFGLAAFDNHVETFEPRLVPGSRGNRDRAQLFLQGIVARGGTELAHGFLEALKLLEGEGGDVLILTDGQVLGSERILADARSAKARLHCLGIGSASQDRFLALLARQTGGVSRFVSPRERVDLCAVDLFAAIGRPIATGLKAGVGVEPEPPSVVFRGTPVLLFGEGEGIELDWDGGSLRLPLGPGDGETAETVRLLRGARLITDWESRYPKYDAKTPEERTECRRVADRIRELSRRYGLASREMSLVAVVKRAGDRPGAIPQTRVVPVGMPQETRFGAYFLTAVATMAAAPMQAFQMAGAPLAADFTRMIQRSPSVPQATGGYSWNAGDVRLLELACRLEPDGGMPGRDVPSRASATVAALLAFLAQGHTTTSGTFRSHVARMVRYLESLRGLPPTVQKEVEEALKRS